MHDQCFSIEDREYTYELCMFGQVTQKPKNGGRNTNLGKWAGWEAVDGHPHGLMKYENGEKCWNGPQRSMRVTLECGASDIITSVAEPNRCEYAMTFRTPAACHPNSLPQHDEL
eukprot:m.78432 g.78432  ORF g.78432 m.78432 type:complete len:114 (+) comp8160_c0_seq5:1259-1600(+)